jgi:hypothetical protein
MSTETERALKTVREPAREIPVVDHYDVIVAGGGTAGIVAAVAAARNGAKILLLERSGFLGGNIAAQLLEHSAGWFDAGGNPIVGGLPEELVQRLRAAGASPGHVRDDTGYTRYRVPVNHEQYKSVVTAWIAEAGVDFLLFSPVCATLGGEGAIGGVIVENKSGRTAYAVPVVVDCTGDADVAALAGCETLSEPGGATQPVSLLFKIGGIDHGRLLDYVEAHPADFKMGVAAPALRGEPFVNLWGFGRLLWQAYADGVLSFERNELHFAGTVAQREAVINLTRHAADATRAEALADAEVQLRRQVLEGAEFFRRYVPGCEGTFLSATAASIGVRESRRIAGVYELSDDDVRTGRDFEDAVALGGFPIDSHDPRGPSMDGTEPVRRAYGIPYLALVPRRVDGLLVAGRCISASRRALASARITGTCMAMGQAVGTAAAMAALGNSGPRQVDIARLRATLVQQGAIL